MTEHEEDEDEVHEPGPYPKHAMQAQRHHSMSLLFPLTTKFQQPAPHEIGRAGFMSFPQNALLRGTASEWNAVTAIHQRV